jgi:gliding motility-associated lipoprotein GldH
VYELPKIFTKKNVAKVAAFFLVLIIAACDKNRVFDQSQRIDKSLWDSDKPVIFTTQIKDTIHPHNVYLNIRNEGSYAFSNLFLFINTKLPGGRLDRDTIEIMLATPEGKWMGKGLGDLWDNRILFKRNVRFPEAGEYRFEITHAMRMNPLPGISDAGLRIEMLNVQEKK